MHQKHYSHHLTQIHFPSIKYLPHIGKVHMGKPISFKEFVHGTNSVIKSVTEPTRDLIHGVEHGFSSFGKGLGTVLTEAPILRIGVSGGTYLTLYSAYCLLSFIHSHLLIVLYYSCLLFSNS